MLLHTMAAFAVPMVRIHLPPAESRKRTRHLLAIVAYLRTIPGRRTGRRTTTPRQAKLPPGGRDRAFDRRSDHRIDRAGILPRPKRRIPIWLGGYSEAAFDRAARIGDGFLFGGRAQTEAVQ